MGQFRTFEDMECWKEARALIRKVRAICKRIPASRDFSFCDQITRAARSIAANIAEGSDALTTPEFISLLGYAKRSSSEVRSHLYDALDEHYVTQEEFELLQDQCRKIQSMIAKLIHYLQSLSQSFKRTYKRSFVASLQNEVTK